MSVQVAEGRPVVALAPRRRRRTFGSVAVESRHIGAVATVLRARDGAEPVTTIEIVTSGSVRMHGSPAEGSPGSERAEAGDALVLSHLVEGTPTAPHGATTVAVSVPSSLLPDVVLSDRPMRIDGAQSQLLVPIREFVHATMDGSTASESGFADYYLERLLQEMVLGLLVDAHRSWSVPASPEVFTFALSVIAAQRTDPDLTAAGVAREVHLSARQLQRVFQSHGTTIEREIRREKVEHALDLLQQRHYDHLSIGEIARDSGFSAGSSLARAMAAIGFPAPGEVRRRSQDRYPIRRA